MNETYALHAQLAADTVPLVDLELSSVLLMDEAAWPWLLLVPRRPLLRELVDLDVAARHLLMDEIAHLSGALQRLYRPDKLNVGALGNMVPQLHVHVIARHVGDPAWPGPVWGARPKQRCTPDLLAARAAQLRREIA
jgi:diadenosine tetraphosphate (Ap4A) HIT family hydrolase